MHAKNVIKMHIKKSIQRFFLNEDITCQSKILKINGNATHQRLIISYGESMKGVLKVAKNDIFHLGKIWEVSQCTMFSEKQIKITYML